MYQPLNTQVSHSINWTAEIIALNITDVTSIPSV
jgi:hypothetical protein